MVVEARQPRRGSWPILDALRPPLARSSARSPTDGALEVRSSGELVADLPDRPAHRRPDLPLAPSPARLARRAPATRRSRSCRSRPTSQRYFLRCWRRPNIASRAPVFSTYDHMVGTDTVVAPGGDAAVLRIKGSRRGHRAHDRRQRPPLLPRPARWAARIAVAEAARNVSCAGARADRGHRLPELRLAGRPGGLLAARRGHRRACPRPAARSGSPVVSGNVSLYNEFARRAIWPTPVVGHARACSRT